MEQKSSFEMHEDLERRIEAPWKGLPRRAF